MKDNGSVVVALTMYMNHTLLPREFRAGWVGIGLMIAAMLFFGLFSIISFYDLLFV